MRMLRGVVLVFVIPAILDAVDPSASVPTSEQRDASSTGTRQELALRPLANAERGRARSWAS
jgi:hypothetical protein